MTAQLTREEFHALADKKILFMDGATGSNLMKAGMPAGVCPETWILSHPEALIDLQKRYVDAGSNIVYAPTFTANRIKLEEYDLQDQIESINRELVLLSRQATQNKAYVAGDITMTGKQLKPMGDLEFEDLVEVYKEQARILVDAGVDLFGVETMMSLQETRAAVLAIKETCDLPIIVTMTFEADGRTLYGTDPVTAAVVLESLGIDAVGVNCSAGPDTMVPFVEQMRQAVRIPIIAKPNAGLPSRDENGNTVYDMGVEEFTSHMTKLVEAGATILGGCCGTAPEYIASIHAKLKDEPVLAKTMNKRRVLASERRHLFFDLDDPFMIIGERINPTGKKKFQEDMRAGRYEKIAEFAEQQEEAGASILDVNMGMSGISEYDMMLLAMDEIAAVSQLPLCIDSSHVDVIEAALRVYPGRALINSISLESEKCDKLLALAAKYGAMFILLPLTDAGLPKDVNERIKNIETLANKAYKYGLCKEDIIVDGLVATVGAQKQAALDTLATIRYCKENGFATTCGLSNISFGLPQRSQVNSAFVTMAIQSGLTMAIANPMQEALMDAIFASDILMNKQEGDIRYIERANQKSENTEVGASNTTALTKALSNKELIYQDVLKGYQKRIKAHTQAAIEEGIPASVILNECLIPAINETGELFDSGKYFLPQLIAGAETMKTSIEYLEPLLQSDQDDGKKMPVIVIATVKGDIHDIGKNLVAMMLKNYGFQVIDLGKDVSKEEIVESAIAQNASIVALSALMTTTMQEMKNVIDYAGEKGLDAKFMIGGAVITQEYADEIGADGYSKDASEAVKVARRILTLDN